MPRASRLVLATDREVRNAKASVPGRIAEFRIKGARNLVLRITPSGTKIWTFLYASPATGRHRKLAIGAYPSKTLAVAKDETVRLDVAVRDRRDPLLEREAENAAGNFSALAKRYMEEHERKNARDGQPSCSTREAQRLLDADILPAIGQHKVEAIKRQHVAAVVEAAADRGSYVVADRVLGLVRAIFNWAISTGRLEANPTAGLKKRNTAKPRIRVLSQAEICSLWNALDGELDRPSAGELRIPGLAISDALKLQLLLGLRVGEVLGAAKSEIDLKRRTWIVPALRTKARREHRLPLSDMACKILRGALQRSGSSPWLFPSHTAEGPIRPHSATTAIRRLRTGIDLDNASTHDLRRTLATGLGDMEVPEEVIDRVLNHAPKTVAGRHYNHAKHHEPMRRALDAWASRLQSIVADESNIVLFRARRVE
jgi:integrase